MRTTYLMHSFCRSFRLLHISTTGPSRSNRFLLKSSSATLGDISAMLAARPSSFKSSSLLAMATFWPSSTTIFNSLRRDCLRQILSNPISWATLPPTMNSTFDLPRTAPGASTTYLSLRAARKLRGASAGRVGRMNEAAVGDFDRPAVIIESAHERLNHIR